MDFLVHRYNSNNFQYIRIYLARYTTHIIKYVSEWFMINAMIGTGKRYLNFNGKVSKYMSKMSYTFYIFHFIWVVLLQYLLYNVSSCNIILLYILPVLFAYGATLICCEICNRVSFFSFLR